MDAQYLMMLCCLQGDIGHVGIMGLPGPTGVKVFFFFLESMLFLVVGDLVSYVRDTCICSLPGNPIMK